MQGNNPKDPEMTKASRRKFLMRAGLGSLPVLLSLKSGSAWGISTQNCSLSQSASQAASVAPERFENCSEALNSHGNAKMYFIAQNGNGNGSGQKAYFYNRSDRIWNGIVINQDTTFNSIFISGFTGTLKQAVNDAQTPYIRNIASLFAHAVYYQMQGIATNVPTPDEVRNAYINAVTPAQITQLSMLLEYYIDGDHY